MADWPTIGDYTAIQREHEQCATTIANLTADRDSLAERVRVLEAFVAADDAVQSAIGEWHVDETGLRLVPRISEDAYAALLDVRNAARAAIDAGKD